MSFSKIFVRDFSSLATRESGAVARALVLERLQKASSIVIDFTGAHPTPSFADEFLGRLAESLGETQFRASIKVQGADAETRPLLQQVIMRRLRRVDAPKPITSALEIA
jgi:hypothetical protein